MVVLLSCIDYEADTSKTDRENSRGQDESGSALQHGQAGSPAGGVPTIFTVLVSVAAKGVKEQQPH